MHLIRSVVAVILAILIVPTAVGRDLTRDEVADLVLRGLTPADLGFLHESDGLLLFSKLSQEEIVVLAEPNARVCTFRLTPRSMGARAVSAIITNVKLVSQLVPADAHSCVGLLSFVGEPANDVLVGVSVESGRLAQGAVPARGKVLVGGVVFEDVLLARKLPSSEEGIAALVNAMSGVVQTASVRKVHAVGIGGAVVATSTDMLIVSDGDARRFVASGDAAQRLDNAGRSGLILRPSDELQRDVLNWVEMSALGHIYWRSAFRQSPKLLLTEPALP